MNNAELVETAFSDTPQGWAQRLKLELESAASDPEYRDWKELGEKIDARFRDKRDEKSAKTKRLNLYPSNVQTRRAITYGKIPQVSVDRKFQDADDDVARVAGLLMERHLNCDIEREGDTQREAFGYALQDFDMPGLGCVRVRYVAEFQKVEAAPGVPEHEAKSYEDAEVDYVHWTDIRWSKARVWHELRLLAFRAEMSKAEVAKSFGEDVAKLIPYSANKKMGEKANPWAQAEVWEVWHKETKSVFFYVEGYGHVLTPVGLAPDAVNPNGSVKDPLGLPGFWPCPRFMLANGTTSTLVPVPDFYLAQDLYLEIDNITTRIDLLVDALKVAGAYDASVGALKQLLSSRGNVMIPVENWPAFQEKNGLQGAVAWWPLEQVAAALVHLRQHRQETMDLLFQVTGMSDLMRGQATAAGATAHEQNIKAKFGSVRLQAMQEEFARFCSDTQRLRAQVIARHFDEKTILERANAQFLPEADRALAPQAVQMLKSRLDSYRIEVKPENVSLSDFAALRQESMEVLTALTSTVQAAAPLAQSSPSAMLFVSKAVKWALSRIRGAKSLEGDLDSTIKQMEEAMKNPQPQQQGPSPEQVKLQAVQMKGQMDLQKEQMKQQGDLQRIQAEVAADAQREQNQMQFNVQEHAKKQLISNALRPPQVAGTKPRGAP